MRPWMRAGSRFLGGSRKWYRAGGAPAPVAVYVPKGAASLAASYVNLANPGTNNAAPGTAPTFATATGWAFAGVSGSYLTTGITPAADGTWTYIVRFSDLTDTGRMFGSLVSGSTRIWIQADNGAGAVVYSNGNSLSVAPVITSGVFAIAGNKAYRNGVVETGTIGAWSGATAAAIYLGAYNNNGAPAASITAKMQAFAVYNATLTAPQVAAVSAAMAAL